MLMRKLLIAAAAAGLLATAALAIQPGTSGTEKRFQDQGLRSGVLIQVNKTATASAGAATLNASGSGIVTSESLTLVAGSPYTLTLTNNMVAAADIVLATVAKGTSATGNPYVKEITPAAGSVVIVIGNATENTAQSYAGTLKIGFLVIKQSVMGAD